MRPMRNIPGTTGERCDCHNDTWIWHHRDVTGSRQRVCSVYGCGNEARVGGHLWFTVGGVEFIAPLCHPCNKIPHHEAFDLKDWVLLAYADRPASRPYNRQRSQPARRDNTGGVVAVGAAMALTAAAIYLLARPEPPSPPPPPAY
jgi:hypothetical protein